MKILPFFIKSILCPSAPFRYENKKLGNQQKQKSVTRRMRSYNRLIRHETEIRHMSSAELQPPNTVQKQIITIEYSINRKFIKQQEPQSIIHRMRSYNNRICHETKNSAINKSRNPSYLVCGVTTA